MGGAGKLTFNAMSFPIKKGQVQVKVDLTLASSVPSSLLKTKTKATAIGANGDKLFCLEIDSAPAEASQAVGVPPPPPPVAVASSDLKLTWQDCGDASTHAKITGFTPGSLTTGQTASMVGTGNLDEDVAGASFDVEMNGVIHLLSCKGDASQSKTCNLPLGAGKLTFNAMSFPIKKGQVQVKVDLTLSSCFPSSLLKTKTKATATG